MLKMSTNPLLFEDDLETLCSIKCKLIDIDLIKEIFRIIFFFNSNIPIEVFRKYSSKIFQNKQLRFNDSLVVSNFFLNIHKFK